MKEPVTRCWIDKDFGHSDFCLKCKYRVECAERSGKEFKVAKNLHKHSSLKEMIEIIKNKKCGKRIIDVEIKPMPNVDKEVEERMEHFNK